MPNTILGSRKLKLPDERAPSLRTRRAVWPWAWLVLEGVATVGWFCRDRLDRRHTLSMAVGLVVREAMENRDRKFYRHPPRPIGTHPDEAAVGSSLGLP